MIKQCRAPSMIKYTHCDTHCNKFIHVCWGEFGCFSAPWRRKIQNNTNVYKNTLYILWKGNGVMARWLKRLARDRKIRNSAVSMWFSQNA